MSIDRWMDKDVVRVNTVEYYSAVRRNTSDSVLIGGWTQSLLCSDVCRADPEKLSISARTWGFWKGGTDDPPAGRLWACRLREQTVDAGCGEERVGELRGSWWDTCSPTCKSRQPAETCCMTQGAQTRWKPAAWCRELRPCGNLLHDAGSSDLVHWDNLEGWGEVGGGSEVQEGGDVYIQAPTAYSCWYMAETNTIL